MHLKDLENRMHEGCGFYKRDLRRILLPGHILLETGQFVEFASYVIRGGAHGWGGECPVSDAVRQAVGDIRLMNLDVLTDPGASPTLAGEQPGESPAKGPHRILADEQFFAVFKEKFANWKPIPSDMARLPEAIRSFILTLQDKSDPDGKARAYAAMVGEQNGLKKQLTDYRQKLLAKDKEVSGLSEYVDSVEAKLTACEKVISDNEKKFTDSQERLVNAQAAFKAEQQAHIDVSNELSLKIARIDELEAQVASLTEDLKVAEELLTQSEEARERQNARFRQGRVSDEAAGEAAEAEAAKISEEPEATGPGTSEEASPSDGDSVHPGSDSDSE